MRNPFAPGAWRYALPVAALAALLRRRFPRGWLAVLALAGAALGFHRDPARDPPESGVLAPADGRVSVIRTEGDRVRVGIFMNLHDVHVNRAPVAGVVESVTHSPGGHWPAFTKASDRNERLAVDFGEYEVTLVAGAVARRIHPYVEPGDELDRGERLGHISFGSRVDVLFPPETDPSTLAVESGDRVTAGETVLATE
jgi:phosphatidylserine decarboxylase